MQKFYKQKRERKEEAEVIFFFFWDKMPKEKKSFTNGNALPSCHMSQGNQNGNRKSSFFLLFILVLALSLQSAKK
jgi:hypothetical protein